jgi:hypothetical protein
MESTLVGASLWMVDVDGGCGQMTIEKQDFGSSRVMHMTSLGQFTIFV